MKRARPGTVITWVLLAVVALLQGSVIPGGAPSRDADRVLPPATTGGWLCLADWSPASFAEPDEVPGVRAGSPHRPALPSVTAPARSSTRYPGNDRPPRLPPQRGPPAARV